MSNKDKTPIEEMREEAKKLIGYNKILTLLGKRDADNCLHFCLEGMKTREQYANQKVLEVLEEEVTMAWSSAGGGGAYYTGKDYFDKEVKPKYA